MKKDGDPWGFAKWTSQFSLKLGLLFRQTACFIFQLSQCLAVPAPGIRNNDPVVKAGTDTDVENKDMDIKGRRGGGMNWETGI